MHLYRLGIYAFCLATEARDLLAADAPTKNYPVNAAPLSSVHVQDDFWLPHLEINRTVTLWHVLKQAEEHGEFDNFAKAAGTMPIGSGFRGSSPARDSDAYKTLEGAAYTLAAHPDPKLERYCDELIANIAGRKSPMVTCIRPAKSRPPTRCRRWLGQSDSSARKPATKRT